MKKIMAMLVSIVMLAGTISPAFASFTDVDDSNRYKDAITALTTLSVIDGYGDGTFHPDGAITRAEFTKLIVFMLGFQNLTYQDYSFVDVEPDFWAANYIQTAYDRGIIQGYGDGVFAPNDPVTYAQALKMVICTLGYDQFAKTYAEEGETDWSAKYIWEANELNITKNVTNSPYNEGASRSVVAQVLYNALEIPIYENNGYTWVKTDKTLLGDYLNVTELKGTLVGVEDDVTQGCTYNLLESQMDILSNSGEEVLIDYSTFTTNKLDLTKYLGSTIKVYYRQLSESDDRHLISIDADSTKNTIIDLSYEDLNGFNGVTLKYYDTAAKSKTIKVKTGDDLTVRYNGKNVGENETVTLNGVEYTRQQALEEWFNPNSDNLIYGNVSLTDGASDGTVDMIQIYDYETIVALSSPSTSDYRISDKITTGNYLILDPQSADYTYTIMKNGAEIPVTSIAANDVVLYAKSLDESLYTLIVSNKTVKGSVASISSDNERMVISGETYNIGSKCINYILEKNNKELKVGVSGTFYLDEFNTAVFGTLDEAAVIPYAYITDAYIDRDEGGKAVITVYAPAQNASEASSYPLKTNVKINGSSAKAEAAISKIAEAAGYADDEDAFAEQIYGAGKHPQNTEYAQPARVTISGGEVTNIVLLTTNEVVAKNEDKEKIMKCKELDKYTYSSSNSFTQDGKTAFSVNANTTVIYVPSDRSNKKNYAKKTVSSAFTTGDSYYLEAYDVNSSKIAGLIILYGNDGTLTKVKKDTDFSVVHEEPEGAYSEVLDSNVQKVEVYSGTNTAKEWTTYSATEFSDLVAGDVIQFAYDSDNLIQGRIDNIRFSDVAKVLDGQEYNGQVYNWEEELDGDASTGYQNYKFDYRFKKSGSDKDEEYTSSLLGTVPYSRAVVFNVSQVLPEENKIYVTKGGFDTSGETPVIDDENYEEITIGSTTKIIRMEDDRKELSRYVDGTTADLTINDLKDAKNYGTDCSKILVCMLRGVAKLIVIYN